MFEVAISISYKIEQFEIICTNVFIPLLTNPYTKEVTLSVYDQALDNLDEVAVLLGGALVEDTSVWCAGRISNRVCGCWLYFLPSAVLPPSSTRLCQVQV